MRNHKYINYKYTKYVKYGKIRDKEPNCECNRII